MIDLNLVLRNGQPMFRSGKYEGILLAFEAKEGEIYSTPGNPEGETDTFWGYLTIVLKSKQKLLAPSYHGRLHGLEGKLGLVGWSANGINPQIVIDLARKINWVIFWAAVWRREVSLEDAVSEICKEYYFLPPFQKWQRFYEFDRFEHPEMIQSRSDLGNGFTVTQLNYSMFFMESGQHENHADVDQMKNGLLEIIQRGAP